MDIAIIQIHPAESPKALNTEWFVLKNNGDKPFSTRGCAVEIGRKGQRKRRALGTLDPGFILAPGDQVRIMTGNPGRKAHGKPPEDELRAYHLFLNEPVVKGAGTLVALTLRSAVITSAVFDADAASGVEPAETPAE